MMRICLDAGHGGTDSGAVNGSHYEKVFNLKQCRMLEEILAHEYTDKNGGTIEVILTRWGDTYPSLQDRVDIGKTCDAFISMHCNSFSNPDANGFEIYYKSTGEWLAKNMQAEVDASKIFASRGVKVRTDLYVLNGVTNVPAVLTECGFISNAGDLAVLIDDSKLNYVVRCMALGIASTFQLKKKDVVNPPTPSKTDAQKLAEIKVKTTEILNIINE